MEPKFYNIYKGIQMRCIEKIIEIKVCDFELEIEYFKFYIHRTNPD